MHLNLKMSSESQCLRSITLSNQFSLNRHKKEQTSTQVKPPVHSLKQYFQMQTSPFGFKRFDLTNCYLEARRNQRLCHRRKTKPPHRTD